MIPKKVDKRVGASEFKALLSDVLPYETPYIFSNVFFFERAQGSMLKEADSVTTQLFGLEPTSRVNYTIPYNYLARSSGGKSRLLSVMHPVAQLRFCSFYDTYFSMVIDRASISEVSLRHPVAVSKRFSLPPYPALNTIDADGVKSSAENPASAASTYFVTEPFNRIFQFYESRLFLQLEARFPHCTSFDLSKCFYNIYSHSVAWAVKERHYAKHAKNASSFENKFDELMQFANFSETNGILVGPEISRIFAEVILQRIDTLVARELDENDIKSERDYVCKRYVDDYFIFSHSQEIAEKAQSVYESLLAKYKLYFNESKIAHSSRPFVTGISAAKHEIFDLVSKFFADYSHIFSALGDHPAGLLPFTYSTREFFGRYQAILAKYRLVYPDLSSLFLGTIRYRLYLLYEQYKLSGRSIQRRQDFIRFQISLVQLTFYVVSTDCKQRLVDISAQVLLVLRDFAANESVTSARILDENIQVEFAKVFLRGDENSLANNSPLEFCSLLIVIKNVCRHWQIPEGTLLDFWHGCERQVAPLEETTPFAYFEGMSLLFFAKDQDQYGLLREEIVNSFLERVGTRICQQYSCLTMTAVDLIACPYLTKAQKEAISYATAKSTLGETSKTRSRAKDFEAYASVGSWFIDWEEEISIGSALLDKELRTAYR